MFDRHPSYVTIFPVFYTLKTRFFVKKFRKSEDTEISDDHLSDFYRVPGSEKFCEEKTDLVSAISQILGESITILLTTRFSILKG